MWQYALANSFVDGINPLGGVWPVQKRRAISTIAALYLRVVRILDAFSCTHDVSPISNPYGASILSIFSPTVKTVVLFLAIGTVCGKRSATASWSMQIPISWSAG